ncbi:MAG: tRNA uridine-5-carboxymethylaminomethyl(34) synthesis GTPase MnmE [Candidatus Aminicenantes bacterium]|nr:tRNA uridine-5-carboxymethylaminomethyl(34) synthesis GTPase MnmE [Candidatus Aminicenantes bacterium]
MSERLQGGTIVAVSTPSGCGGVGIVRLSGPNALDISLAIFRPKKNATNIPPGRAVFGVVADPEDGRPFDEGFLLYFRAPRSYTGEDVVELDLHGSPVLLDEVVRLAVKQGARPAEPGEFTLRAFLAGRIDVLQAEAVDDLIRATSLLQAKSAFRGVEGALSRKIAFLRREVISLSAEIEAEIEFPEENLPSSPDRYVEKIDRIHSETAGLIESYHRGRFLSRGVTIALVGRTNSGKSTLFNNLLKEERAIVTPFAGTTRDFLRERFRLKDASFNLIDMAGLGRPGSPVEREGIERGIKIAAEADGLLFLLDGSREMTQSDRKMILSYRDRKVILIVNKADLGKKIRAAALRRLCPGFPIVSVSALKGTGIGDLRELIYRTFRPLEAAEDLVVFRKRDRLFLEEMSAHLLQAKKNLLFGEPIETVAEEAREIVSVIARMTGEIRPDDILNEVFSRFCIGK